MKLKISAAAYCAIMAIAVRTARREDWLIAASKEVDALNARADGPGNATVASVMMTRFHPFAERLRAASTYVPTVGSDERVRFGFFVEFSKAYLGDDYNPGHWL